MCRREVRKCPEVAQACAVVQCDFLLLLGARRSCASIGESEGFSTDTCCSLACPTCVRGNSRSRPANSTSGLSRVAAAVMDVLLTTFE